MEGLLEEFTEEPDKPLPEYPHRAGPIPNGSPPPASPELHHKAKDLGHLRAIADDELRDIGIPMPN